ncbi:MULTISPECIES: metal-sensing transcriptional repressor [unclassified Dehalobacter]|uniref:metal-sensing transcriptional repressor n=1 Tax=unclassified Dehalobacter TaxID=2635733 RepID=UPI00035C66EA|nr:MULTISPECIES: metal-sensing transcriptional repressor [unclassified Dehalobacter]RJE48208.1 transcriptional regulator [Dehalobacter sp. MCB1]TCX49686.1 transcriptional regulator [Dehalobacter sp. 14DCB1]TCX50191.1 transcriptional regulator [Dehalobacter sp. 12DCB1]
MNIQKKQALQALKTAQGQIEATIKMIEGERYCVDVSNQIFATQSLLKKANLLILKQHMEHCVTEAFEQGNGREKIDEIIQILAKVTNK